MKVMLNKIVDDIYTYMYYKNMIDYFSFFSLKNIGGECLKAVDWSALR